ncbi:hypothetical protein IAG41_08940 [Sphingomonas sp. JC676]|uniref:hypothetical protein n=1 Tax=Sphingomonas sp. JC676 TaxID=2768065 RepID=UPI001657CB5C|nr:hypothetical protein [Sphingomonas sp. JC676]MBC9032515.1 hypothetical protein [Sphingomonas sp. JC676]
MDAGKPDRVENERRGRSLAEGLRAAARGWRGRGSASRVTPTTPSPIGRRTAAIVALLIAAGPLVTLLGAEILAARARSEAAGLNARLAPRAAAERTAEGARTEMRAAATGPMLGVTLEAIARALPANANVLRAERTRDGAVELEVSTPDPDQLRPALRTLPGIGTFRNTGQRQGETGMVASFRAERP